MECWKQSDMRPPESTHVLPFREVLEQCALRPNDLAIVAYERRVTYGELGRSSENLGSILLQAGVAPGDVVAVCLGARPEQLVAMLAIFRIGAIYLPLDPTHPAALIACEIEEATPKVVIYEAATAEHFATVGAHSIDVDTVDSRAKFGILPNVDVALDAVALIFFTSGTTGRPKGVRVTHRNQAQLVRSARAAYGFSSADSFSSIARYTFSISMFELLSPLTVGGTLILSRRDDVLNPPFLVELLKRVTVLHAGPSLLSRLSRFVEQNPDMGPFPGVRHVSTGGDIVLPDVMERAKVLFPRAELFVIYGCTEICCTGTAYSIPRNQLCTKSYVGKPFPGMGVKLMTEGRVAAPGAVGEICFSGFGVVPGYLNRPEVEREKFLEIDGVRHYRTGDLGRCDETGNLEFLGRNDFQVQIRGMRVELVGIENAIRELRLADECAATLRHFDEGDDRLVVFVQAPRASPSTVRAQLAERFPAYMVPSHVVPVKGLPLTVNGKLDRRGLQDLPIPLCGEPKPGPARSELESRVMQTFASALGLPSVGPDDNFFDLGGHSLLAVAVAERLQNLLLGLPVTAGTVFQAQTPRALVDCLRAEHLTRPIPLNACKAKQSLHCLMGVRSYARLAQHLEDRFSVYGVYVDHEFGFFERGSTATPVPELASGYIEVIRREQPSGPYRILGHSFGGLIAYEVARQLLAAGERVEHLFLVDTWLPEVGWSGRLRKATRVLRSAGLRERVKKKAKQVFLGTRHAEFSRHRNGRFATMEALREDAYLAAGVEYARCLRPLPIATTLILSGNRFNSTLALPDFGWARHLPRLERKAIKAGHLQILEDPAVERVAEIVRAT